MAERGFHQAYPKTRVFPLPGQLDLIGFRTRALRLLGGLAPLRAGGAEVVVVDGGSADRSAELAGPLADQVLAAPRGRASQLSLIHI